jgi:hypothetical protein
LDALSPSNWFVNVSPQIYLVILSSTVTLVGGVFVGLLYQYYGGVSSGGTDMILDKFHDSLRAALSEQHQQLKNNNHKEAPSGTLRHLQSSLSAESILDAIPFRMAPLVFGGTVVTHLFGGSAGREGTALQVGAAFGASYIRLVRYLYRSCGLVWHDHHARTIVVASLAAGFGGLFGTPLAGAVFAIEVLTVGRMAMDMIIPCILAALLADW